MEAITIELVQHGPEAYTLARCQVGHLRLEPRAAARLLPPPPLLKADALPPGARWITVHPNGPGTKGVPVMVQEQTKGSGIFHVIGGAGGHLNYLKLRGVKSPEQYAQDAKDRADADKITRKANGEADKAAGLTEQRRQAQVQAKASVHKAEVQYIQQVSEAMGWEQPPTSDADAGPPATPEARKKHREALRNCEAAIELQRKAIVEDASLRAAALGKGVPVVDPEAISVVDLCPARPHLKTGIKAAYGDMAKAQGSTKEKVKAEVKEIRSGVVPVVSGSPETADSTAPGSGSATESGGATESIPEAAEKVAAPTPPMKPAIAEAAKAMALLQARKKLQLLRGNAQAAMRGANAAPRVEGKGYVLTIGTPEAADIEKAVADELTTLTTRSFLAKASEHAGAIAPHVADGTANALHAASMSLAGVGAVDRSVVDVVGAGAAAQLLARRLHADLKPEEMVAAQAAMEAFHSQTHQDRAEAVLKQVAEAQALASQPLGDPVGAEGLTMAAAAHLARSQAVAEANQALGRTLGEFEANAALVAALKAPPVTKIQTSLGGASLEQAVRQLHALGLEKGEYELQRVGASVLLTVKGAGLDKLAAPVDRDTLERVARNVALARGDMDEDDWLPQGFASRPDLALKVQPGAAPSLATDFAPGPDGDLAAELRTYIGGRAADGHSPADILSDIQSAAFYEKAGASRTQEYRAALDAIAPNKVDGKALQRAEELQPLFEQYADEHVAALGGERSPLHSQSFKADETGQEAAHRALAAVPEGVAAYKSVGDLTPQDQGALRGWFQKNLGAEGGPDAAAAKEAHDAHLKDEPQKVVEDLFGEQSTNPEWHAWDSARQELHGKVKAAGFGWPDYVKAMGSPSKAYGAVQDLVRSHVAKGFADAYNTLRPGSLAVGRSVVRDNLRHLSAVDPEARAARQAKQAALIDALRERSQGKYSAGSVSDKLDKAAEQQAAFEQSQAGFWSAEPEAPAAKPLAKDERHTIGHAAEQKLSQLVAQVGGNFEPGKPVRLFHATMSGPDGAIRQRAIKHVRANKRSVLGLGVGSGKTAIMLGAFADAHGAGEAKKGLFCVPSIVQGQFGAEALRFLKPGQFKFHCDPGASFDERKAAYKDPDTHFSVVTHQGFRDDVVRMASEQGHGDAGAIASKLAGLGRAERQSFIAGVLAKEGIKFDFAGADEAHGFLDREGKEDSRLSHVVGAVTDSTPYYVHASADPVKNDASEAFSLLSKMDPARYGDRDAFMRRYGGDTLAAGQALRREMARHVYSASLKPDVKVTKKEQLVPVAGAQHEAIKGLDAAASKVRLARMQGKQDEAAARAVAPHLFEGLTTPEEVAGAVKQVHDSLPLMREAAVRRIIDNHPEGGKVDALMKHAEERKGKPGVVFARSLEAVETLRGKLEAAGHRVITITGADTSEQKAEKIRAFNPEQGERKADIVLCSDAGAVGANLQSGEWLAQYDTPDTAMVHAQRQGRINRIGQKNAIELTDFVADHPREKRARERLSTKYGLRELVTTPLESLDDTGLAFHLKQQQVAQQQAGLF